MAHESPKAAGLFTFTFFFHSYLTAYLQLPSRAISHTCQFMQISSLGINKVKLQFPKSWKVLRFRETN